MPDTRKLLLEFDTDEVGRLARTNTSEMKALVRAFTDSSDVVRERALIAAIEVADPNVVTDIVKAMNDDAANVRIAAAQALAFYHQPRTVPNLLEGLKDSNTWVRSHCAAGLSRILNGPLWARIPEDTVDKMINDFPDMLEEDISRLLTSIKMKPDAINKFMDWRSKKFDLDIDVSMMVEELEGTPILLTGEVIKSGALPKTAMVEGLSEDVESILSELPDEIIATLPPEDLKRLTPASARELVQKLKVSLPTAEKKKKKKAVKVRKVTKVKKKETGPTRASLIKKLPPEVRDSVSDETLSGLTIEELEALLASSSDTESVEEEKVEDKEEAPKYDDPRMEDFVNKYGKEKAELLITIPESMLEGIPEEQIKEMDLETLQGLSQALEPR
ncbi:HEAT repeat domain-containing protein [Candidatus Thorarchaeota archaeon]|nr:MAG: HEAT repeat domain-containing protein [Candidatus Thorarchaeota archaeon]